MLDFENWPVNPLDLVFLIVIGFSMVVGVLRGFVREALTVGAWVLAYFFAMELVDARPSLLQPLRDLFDGRRDFIADIVTRAGMVLALVIVFALAAWPIGALVRGRWISAVDRLLGLGFGAGRALILFGLAYLALLWLWPPSEHPQWVREAQSRSWIQYAAAELQPLFDQHESMPPVYEGAVATAPAPAPVLTAPATGAPASATSAPPAVESGYDPRARTDMQRLAAPADVDGATAEPAPEESEASE